MSCLSPGPLLTSSVELSVLDDRRVRSGARVPVLGHRRLLIGVSVEQHRLGGGVRSRDDHVEHRRAARLAQHLQRQAGNILRLDPVDVEVDGAVHVTVRLPLGVESRTLVRDGDIVLQRLEHGGIPRGGDQLRGGRRVQTRSGGGGGGRRHGGGDERRGPQGELSPETMCVHRMSAPL